MVLKIKHSTFYYKKYNLDIWGVLFTTFGFKKRPQLPSVKELIKNEWRKFKKKKLFRKFTRKFYKIFLKKKYSKFPTIKLSSKKNTKYVWKIKSRKMSKLQLLFYKYSLNKKRSKRRRKMRFLYTLDEIRKMKKFKRMKARFTSIRLTKMFYITMTYRQFRKLARIMKRKIGAFENNYLLALEGRLMSYLYRTSLITNPFYSMRFVQEGNVLVDFKCQKHYNYRLKLNQMVTFSAIGKRILFLTVIRRLKKKRSYFNAARYLYLSYVFLFSYMFKPPVAKDLVFPINIDFYRTTGYAF